jgi:hypothetical protein
MHSIIGHHHLKEMGNETGIPYSYKYDKLSSITTVMSADEDDGRKCKRLNI